MFSKKKTTARFGPSSAGGVLAHSKSPPDYSFAKKTPKINAAIPKQALNLRSGRSAPPIPSLIQDNYAND